MPGSFGMLLYVNFFARDARAKTLLDFWLRSQIFADCDANIFQRLFARRPLAVAAREIIAPNGETLVRFHKRYAIGHYPKMQQLEKFLNTFVSTAR
jgi:hypothetical protein